MMNGENPSSYAFAYEVMTGVDMLCARVVFRVFCQGLSAFIVNVKREWNGFTDAEFNHYISQP